LGDEVIQESWTKSLSTLQRQNKHRKMKVCRFVGKVKVESRAKDANRQEKIGIHRAACGIVQMSKQDLADLGQSWFNTTLRKAASHFTSLAQDIIWWIRAANPKDIRGAAYFVKAETSTTC